MPTAGYYNNSSALLRSMVPHTSYAQMSAQKDRELQYATALAEQERVDQQEQERKIQLTQQTLAQMKALPFEAPDQQRLKLWVLEKQKDVAKRIETEYNGDEQKFVDAEGLSWIQNTYAEMQSTDLFNNAQRNKEMISMAKSAIGKNHNLVGKVGNDGTYRTAEQDLLDYYSGAAASFSFNGSYDPKSQVIDHFGKQDNPYGSKYDQSAAVPETDILNFLQAEKGGKEGMDLFYRNYRGRNIGWKKYSIEDKTLFDLDVEGKQSMIDQRRASAAASLAKATQDKTTAENNAKTFFERTLSNPLSVESVGTFDPKDEKGNVVIPGVGVKLGDIATTNAGKSSIEMTKLNFDRGSEAASASIGVTERVVNGNKKYSGSLPGIITSGNKPRYIDLSNVKHTITKSDPYLYMDGADKLASGTQGGTPKRGWKYFEAIIRKDDAKKIDVAGLPLETRETKDGKKVEFYRLKGYTGLPNIWNDNLMNFDLSKQIGGQKQTNEIFNSVPQNDIFEWE